MLPDYVPIGSHTRRLVDEVCTLFVRKDSDLRRLIKHALRLVEECKVEIAREAAQRHFLGLDDR